MKKYQIIGFKDNILEITSDHIPYRSHDKFNLKPEDAKLYNNDVNLLALDGLEIKVATYFNDFIRLEFDKDEVKSKLNIMVNKVIEVDPKVFNNSESFIMNKSESDLYSIKLPGSDINKLNPYTSLGDRHNEGKIEWSLVDYPSLESMVQVLQFGAKKYGRFNWKKGLKTTEICESMLRHIYAYLDGVDIDEESGLPIEGHILCNAMFLSYMIRNRKDLDTRSKQI